MTTASRPPADSDDDKMIPMDSMVIRKNLGHVFTEASIGYVTVVFYALPWYLLMYAYSVWGLGPESAALYGLLFFLSTLLVAVAKILLDIVSITRFCLEEFTPPYNSSNFDVQLPRESDRLARHEFQSIPLQAGSFGLLMMTLSTAWLCVTAGLIRAFGDLQSLVAELFGMVPDFVSTMIVESLSNRSGLEIGVFLAGIDNPVDLTVLLLAFGPFFLFGTLASWNFMYAIRESLRGRFRS